MEQALKSGETIEVITAEEKQSAKRTKKRLFFIWLAGLIVVVGVIVMLMMVNLYQVSTDRDRGLKVLGMTLSIILGAVFAGGSLFFFSIKYRLTRKYVKMIKDMDSGLKDETIVKFVEYDENVVMKDGVYFYTMVVDSKPLRRDDITKRNILIEHTIEKPQIYTGQKLRVITHANILMSFTPIGEIVPPPEDDDIEVNETFDADDAYETNETESD